MGSVKGVQGIEKKGRKHRDKEDEIIKYKEKIRSVMKSRRMDRGGRVERLEDKDKRQR